MLSRNKELLVAKQNILKKKTGNCVKGMEHMLEMMWQCIVDSESSIDRKKKKIM